MRRALVPLLLVLAACAQNPVTTVIVVRHADRESQAQNSPLSAAGMERANELARMLAGVPVAAIYVTPFLRTQQTAAPLARAGHITPVIVTTGKDYPQRLAQEILARSRGETAVVVTHGDILPDVLRALGVPNPPSVPATEYDDLFVCSVDGSEPARLLALRYGAVKR